MKGTKAADSSAKKSATGGPAKSDRTAGKANQSESAKAGASASKLQKLFEDMLKDIYWAEKALTKAIPKMIKNATSEELQQGLTDHLEETENQIQRLEQVFELLGKKAAAKKCMAMEGLIKEAEEIMEENDEGAMRDAGIIAAGQKVEHYEIATYGTLRTFAQILGMEEAVALLEETLEEEKGADEKLTEVAEAAINIEAASEEEEEDED